MADYGIPKSGVAYIFYGCLVSQADTKLLKSGPTLAAGDFKVSIDGGAFANLATLPTNTPGTFAVKFSLSAAEMTGDNILVVASDVSGAEWCDQAWNIQTSPRGIADLAYPATSGRSMVVDAAGLVDANAVKVGPTGAGTAQTAGDIPGRLPAALGANGNIKSDVRDLLGTAWLTPGVAGTPDVNAKQAGGTAWGSGAITAGSIATDAITAAKIAADAIGASELAADAVTEIQAAVAAGAVASVTGAVGSIASGGIAAASFAAGAINAAAIAADAIGASELAADAVTEIQSGLATAAALATVQADTDDIQTRLPAALVSGRMDSSVGAYPGNTAQTGDNYARLGAPAGVSVSADVAAVKTDTGNLVARITSALFNGITSLAQWLGLLAGKQAGNSTARTEVRATGAGSGTFDETTDSQEALRDRGDAAWADSGTPPTAAAISTQVNADLTTAHGSGSYVRNTEPLDAAGVRGAVGLGSANLDTQLDALPTNTELATALGTADDAVLAAIAALNNLSSAGAQAAAAAALTAYGAATGAQVAAAPPTAAAIAAATRDVNNASPAASSLGAAVNNAVAPSAATVAAAVRDVNNTSPAANSLGAAVNSASAPTVGQIDTQLSGTHGAGIWGGGAGSGANTVTLTVSSSGHPVPGLRVTIKNVGETAVQAVGTTDSNGQAVFNLDNGTYHVLVTSTPPYAALAAQTLVVSGTTAASYNLIQFVPGSPATADQCRIYGYFYLADGATPVAGRTVTATLVNLPQVTSTLILEGAARSTTSDSAGYWYLDLVQGKSYQFRVPEEGINVVVAVPAASGAELRGLL